MSPPYFDKKLIEELFGKVDSLNIEELKVFLDMLKSTYSDKITLDGPRLSFPSEKPSLLEVDPKPTAQVFSDMQYYFDDVVNWRNPKTQFNITPPPLLNTLSSHFLVDLLNPTMATKAGAGNLVELEIDVAEFFAKLINWDPSLALSISTFGGTGTILYGLKTGLNKSNPLYSLEGVKDAVIISNDLVHAKHLTCTDWLGVGTSNNIVLKTNNGVVDPEDVYAALKKQILKGKRIGCIILNAGDTLDNNVDPIKDVYAVREKVCKEFNLDYVPHIHVDAVSGWVFLLFEGYDFENNPLNISKVALEKIKNVYSLIKGLEFADSFGVDFHKTGFTQYISSVFVLKNKDDVEVLKPNTACPAAECFKTSTNKAYAYTLETSRSAQGLVSTYVALSSLGKKGYQYLISHFMNLAEDLRSKLKDDDDFILCNGSSQGWCTLFLPNFNDEPTLFSNILNSLDNAKINSINSYQEELYTFLTSGKNANMWDFSLIQAYDIKCLRLYPMSPYTTIEHNDEFIAWFKENKKEFDKQLKKSFV